MRTPRSIRWTGAPCLAAVIVWAMAVATVTGQQAPAQIWDGIYTAPQAERGRSVYMTACVRCHGTDLTGTTAPPLTGDRFMTTWGGESLERLFVKIRDTMPPNFGTILDDAAKLDVVTFILQTGGYPTGNRELTVKDQLAAIQILRKGEQATVQNFALVQTVGCLARSGDNAWILTRTAEPTVAREDRPPADALAAAAARPLGGQTFLLFSVRPFDPEGHVGRKMEARGLVYRDGEDARLTLTSLTPVGSCAD